MNRGRSFVAELGSGVLRRGVIGSRPRQLREQSRGGVANVTAESVGTRPDALGLGLYADLVDQKTLDILDRRRRTSVGKRRGWLVRRALAIADVVGLLAAFFVAQWLFGDGDKAIPDRVDLKTETLLFLLTLPGWIVAAKIYGLYDRDEERTDYSTADDVVGVFHMLTVGSWLLFAGAWVTGWADPQLPKLIAFWLLGVVAVPSARAAARAYCHRHPLYIQNTIVVGAGDVGQRIARKLLNHPEYGLNLVGLVDQNPKERRADLGHLTLLGDPEQLSDIVHLLDVDRVIIAFSGESAERTVELVRELQHRRRANRRRPAPLRARRTGRRDSHDRRPLSARLTAREASSFVGLPQACIRCHAHAF